MDIQALWHENISVEWFTMLLLGLFFVFMNTIIFLATTYVRRNIILEYGYPKRNRKTKIKHLAMHSKLDNLLLIRLTYESERKGLLLFINIVCHYICLVCLCISVTGFFCCMITLADGWALMLLTMSELAALMLTTAIEFIPHLIWLPSERKRYSRK